MLSTPPVALELVAAGKRYRPVEGRFRTATDHWALRDLHLEVRQGDTLGVLGHNGAGKTTLLRLLGGVTRPSCGRVRMLGRVVPLISVGVGFHQELSGRENVLLNGLLLGLDRAEVARRYDEIVAFSELDDVLDVPVKRYSSGMLMRLAFSVAMHAEPDVLLVDEVLAVGDLAFQLKCLDRMRTLQQAGTTIVMVSHSLHAIRLLCTRVVVLDHGRLAFDGAPDEAVTTYLALLGAAGGDADAVRHGGSGGAHLRDRALLDSAGRPAGELQRGQRYRLSYRLGFDVHSVRPRVELVVVGETGSVAYRCAATVGPPEGFAPGTEVPLEIPFTAGMGGGTYRLSVRVLTADRATVLAEDVERTVVYRPPAPGTYGVAELDARITLGGRDLSDHAPVQIGGCTR